MQKKMQRKIVLISHCFPRSRSNLASPFFPPPSLRSIVQKRLAVWSISMVKSNPNYRSDPEVTITFGRYGQASEFTASSLWCGRSFVTLLAPKIVCTFANFCGSSGGKWDSRPKLVAGSPEGYSGHIVFPCEEPWNVRGND
ncbi:uncharacterized protein [Euphorbia lathyris]|uniref:uncharacterized protein isoform X4 n=1 Tax=Euphorbia lathyris TaxID=212925 RepID=UPI00331318D1